MRVERVQADDAEGEVRKLLERFEQEHGKRPVLWTVLANHPMLLEAHAHFYENTILKGNLDQDLKELVGVVVSTVNECEFCVASHRGSLVDLFGYSGERVEQIANGDFEGLSDDERVALEFATQVATNPQGLLDTDVSRLRDVGYSDQDVVELVGAIAQFVAANVYADTFAISPDLLEDH